MKANLKKTSQDLRNWLNRTKEATGLKKSIIVTGILMSYALKSNEEDAFSTTNKNAVKSKKYPKRGNI
ncbi:hypothetical protein [Akkermansia biwaensis]